MDALPNEIISMILSDTLAPNTRMCRYACDMIMVCKCVCKLWYAVTRRMTGCSSTRYNYSDNYIMFCALAEAS